MLKLIPTLLVCLVTLAGCGRAPKTDWSHWKEILVVKEDFNHIAISSDGRKLSATLDGTPFVSIFDIDSGSGRDMVVGPGGAQIMTLRFSPSGDHLLVAGFGMVPSIRNCKIGPPVKLTGHAADTPWASYSPSGDRVATCGNDRTAALWNAKNGKLLHRRPLGSAAHAARISPDGQWVMTADNNALRIWDSELGALKWIVPHWQHMLLAQRVVDIARDSSLVAYTDAAEKAMVFDARRGRLVAELSGHTDTIVSVRMSPNGKQVVTASRDNTMRLWEVSTGKCLMTVQPDSTEVSFADFMPDGSAIIMSCKNRVMIIDIGSGLPLCELSETNGARLVNAGLAVVSGDGERVAAAFWNETIIVWERDTTERAATVGKDR